MIKAIISFTGFADAELCPAATRIIEQMTKNVAVFPAPSPSLASIQALMDVFSPALGATVHGPSKSQTITKNNARAAFRDGLRELGLYVNGIAKGDAMIVELSGFPSYDTAKVPLPSIRPAPQNVRLKHGRLPGTVEVRFTPFMPEDSQEVQVHLGDPNDEAGWVSWLIVRGGKGLLQNLPPGAKIWARVRSVNAKGQPGACSDPAEIRVV